MKVFNEKEGSFYNNKILVVSVLMLMLLGVVFFVYGSIVSPPTITFNSPSLNNSFTSDSTPFINITFTATTSADNNVTIINNTINVTINSVVYNFSDMTCAYIGVLDGALNESMICNFSTRSLVNGTYNILAQAMDNASGPIARTLYNYTVYTGSPSVESIFMEKGDVVSGSGDNYRVKAGNFTIKINFDRIMNTNISPIVNLVFDNGSIVLVNQINFSANIANFTNNTATRKSSWHGFFNFTPDYPSNLTNISYPDGPVKINISWAYDIASNVMTANDTFRFTKDTVAPFVNISMFAGANQSNFSILFNYTDNLSATAFCILYVNNSAPNNTVTAQNKTVTSMLINNGNLDGYYNSIVECNDTANNRRNSSAVGIYVDKTLPNIPLFNRLNGRFANLTHGKYLNLTNVSDTFTNRAATGIVNDSIKMAVYINGVLRGNFSRETAPAITVLGNLTKSEVGLDIILNLTAVTPGTLPQTGDEVSYILYLKDYAGNEQTRNTTFYIDNDPPTIATPSLNRANATYEQGENFTLSATITDSNAGLNVSQGSFYINTTTMTDIGNVSLTCTGKNTATCTYKYNTTKLAAGTYVINGSIQAWDDTVSLSNYKNSTISVALVITEKGGGPTIIGNISSNRTHIVKNVGAELQISVSVNDTNGVSMVWATYAGNSSTTETCVMWQRGTVANTFVNALGNCSIYVNSTKSGTTLSGNTFTLTINANSTNNARSSTTYTLIAENELINVSSFSAPSLPYLTQLVTINTTVFSWNGTPDVSFNVTNATNNSAAGRVLNTSCVSLNAKAAVYYCAAANLNVSNITSALNGNSSTISIVNASLAGTLLAYLNDSSLPSALTMSVATEKALQIGAPPTMTLNFINAGITIAGPDDLWTTVNLSNSTHSVKVTDSSMKSTVLTLNNVNLGARIVNNLSISVVAPNSSNGTNFTTIQSSLSTDTATLLTALVIQPMINNTSTGFTGSTIAFNCTALGITCGSATRVYSAPFNMTTNLTIGTTWTKITDANTVWSDPWLNVTVNSFSIFALATPKAAAAATTTTTTTSSGGGGGGGIGYLLARKVTAFDLIDMIRAFYEGTSTKTAFDIIDSIRKFYEQEAAGGTQ